MKKRYTIAYRHSTGERSYSTTSFTEFVTKLVEIEQDSHVLTHTITVSTENV